MVNEIYIIDDDESSIEVFKELFRDESDYEFISVRTEQIDMALQNIPLLIVINEDSINIDIIEICKKIRKDEDNTITPVTYNEYNYIVAEGVAEDIFEA